MERKTLTTVVAVSAGMFIALPLAAQPGAQQREQASGTSQQQMARANVDNTQQQQASSRINFDTNTSIERGINQRDQVAISRMAGRLVTHAAKARRATLAEDKAQASEQVNKALELVKIIKDTAPVYRVTTNITSGDTTYRDEERVQPLVVPLFAELNQVTVLGASTGAQHFNQQQQKPGQQRSEQTARRGGPAPGQQQAAPIIEEAGAASTVATIDIRDAEAHLRAAQKRIDSQQYEQASQLLAAITDSISVNVVAADLPLLEARQNVMLAQSYFNDNQPAAGQTALRAAAQSLEEFAKVAPENQRADVRQLQREIASAATQKPSDANQMNSRIENWWDTLSSITSDPNTGAA